MAARKLAPRLAVFAAWLAAVLFMTSRHEYWRDEGRALSIALQGDGPWQMLVMLRGEGHPALWYLLLRAAHAVVGSALVLPVVSIAAIGAAALLLLFASPFPLWLVCLVLTGGPFLFEYSVMARNYGISAPLLFGMAALYPRRGVRFVWLGLLAALLANANAHSALLAGGFMLLWALDLALERRLGWIRATGHWAIAAGLAAAGVVASAVTLYPPVNDGAVAETFPDAEVLALAVLLPAANFDYLSALGWANALRLVVADPAGLFRVMSAVLYVSAAGLVRWPAALVAGLATLIGMSLFFRIVYVGLYRHQSIWLLMLVALYWMVWRRAGWRARGGAAGLVARTGFACFVLLLALQVPVGVRALVDAASGAPPLSEMGAVARAIRSRPDLRDAIVMADPDAFVEAFPIYADNPIYMPRGRRFSRVARLTRRGTVALSLGDLLRDAEALCRTYDRPVVLAVLQDLHAATLPRTFEAEAYNWSLSVSPDEFAALSASTEFLGRFAPSLSGEDFDVYALRPPCSVR